MVELKFKLKPEIQASSVGGGFTGNLLKGVAGGGLGSLLKLAGPIAIAIGILTTFKPLVNIIKSIGRILTEFLRPVADVILILLMPILQILRPLLIIFRAAFAPFRKAALQLASEGGKALAKGDIGRGTALVGLSLITILKPFTDIILKLQTEVLKLLIKGISFIVRGFSRGLFEVLAVFASFFSDSVADKIRVVGASVDILLTDLTKNAITFIDNAVDSLVSQGNQLLIDAAAELGVAIQLPTLETNINAVEVLFLDFAKSIEKFGVNLTKTLDELESTIKGASEISFGKVGDVFRAPPSISLTEEEAMGNERGGGRRNIEIKGKPGSVGDFLIRSIVDSIGDFFESLDLLSLLQVHPLQSGIRLVGDLILSLFGSTGTVPSSVDTSFKNMNASTTEFVTKSPSAYSTAISGMNTTTQNYVTNLQAVTFKVEDLVRKIESLHNAAASAAERARSNSRRGR